MQQHLEQSLKMLRTDYIDIYQLHCAPRVYRPGEEDGIYDWLLQKKKEGAIRHISVTAHRIGVAEEPWKAVSTIPCNTPSRSSQMNGSCGWPSVPRSLISASSP